MKKVKVLRYANDGNTVVRPYMELQKMYADHDNIFQAENPDATHRPFIVYKYDNVFVQIAAIDQQRIEPSKELLFNNYEQYLEKIPEQPWIQMIFIELYKDLGRDTLELLNIRQQQILDRDEKTKKEDQRKQQEYEEYQRAMLKIAKADHQKIVNGESITVGEFLHAVELLEFYIPGRTLGAMQKIPKSYKASTGTIYLPKGIRSATAQSFLRVLKAFAEFTPTV